MGLKEQGSKPTGLIGKIIGQMMNRFHTPLYIDYFKNKLPENNSQILDIGCGGGKFLKFLYDSNKSYLLYGLDHSHEMIELSKKTNEKAIKDNQLNLIQGSASQIKLENSQFELITAFETIQFWPDIDKSFLRINQLLKAKGRFIIINYYPSEGSKWWETAKIKTDKEYIQKLENAGFRHITVDLKFKKGWIIINATK